MRIFIILAATAVLASANPQGFFDTVRNTFLGGRSRPARQNSPNQFRPNQPNNFRPPPQPQPGIRQNPQQQAFLQPRPQQNGQPPRFQTPPQQQFRGQQQFANNNFGVPAQGRPIQSNNNFRPQQQQQSFRNNNNNNVQNTKKDCNRPTTFNSCPGTCAQEEFFDPASNTWSRYLLTWNINDGNSEGKGPCNTFEAQDAEAYCKAQGGRVVSLDSNEKAEFAIGLAIRDAKRYFWTGGKIDHNAGTVSWPTGKSEGIGTKGARYWSPTGFIKQPQPDNRDGDEFCLAVLNNFYADGVKWHDVGCHHKKPTICEFSGRKDRCDC